MKLVQRASHQSNQASIKHGFIQLWSSLLLALVLCIPSISNADDDPYPLSVHGFVSQGYLRSTDNDYLVDSDEGSAEFSEAALTFSTQLSDRLRLGIQFVARDLGLNGDNNVILDWAFGDYRWQDYLGIRIGKTKIMNGLYNLNRDIEMARIPIFLPPSVYIELTRDYSLTNQGGTLYGNINLGLGGDLDYELTIGTLNLIDPKSGPLSSMLSNSLYPLLNDMPKMIEDEYGFPPGSVTVGITDISEASVTVKLTRGFSLLWNTPVEGFRIGGTFYNIFADALTTIDLSIETPIGNSDQTISSDSDIVIEKYLVLSSEYNWRNVTLSAELLSINIGGVIEETSSAEKIKNRSNTEGYYGMISYRINETLGISTYYSEFFPNRDDKNGSEQVKTGRLPNDYYAWQKELCLSTMIDINPNWLMKFEIHMLNGTAMVMPRYDNVDLIEDWYFFAVKNTFNF